MPGIVWSKLDRLAADIEARRKSSPCLDQASASVAGSLALDPITLQNLSVLLQQLPRPSTTVTTLPDLSASLPKLEGSPKQNVKEWLEDVRHVQQLASWEDATTRLIAASKLKGTARNWHLAFGSQYDTWPTGRVALKETFITEWTLIHWQERAMDVTQGIGESLHQYAFAKLRIIQRCPVTLSDPQKIDYLLQGMRDQHIVAALAANRPTTVQAFLATCTSLDRSAQHAKSSPSTTPGQPNYQSHSSKSARSECPTHPTQRSGFTSPSPAASRQRIADLPIDLQEARYEAISSQYGAPAFRNGQDLSQAVCYKCKHLGHLASKCTTYTNQSAQASSSAARAMPTAPLPPALHTMLATLEGSQLQCPFFSATITGIGDYDAFPDSGSKLTLIAKSLVPERMLHPWTEPPLEVVRGTTVLPAGAALLKITIGPIAGVVQAAVLEHNILPFIIGEDWFRAVPVRLIFEPPQPVRLQHTVTGLSIIAEQKLAPRMSNAVILTQSSLNSQVQTMSQDCLQREPLPSSEQPSRQAFAQETPCLPLNSPNAELPAQIAGTVVKVIHVDLPPALLGDQLSFSRNIVIADILTQQNGVFARHEDDLGYFTGMQHRIDLLPNALPYSRSPYRYAPEDRRFLEKQIKKLLDQGVILPASGPWAFPAVVVSRGDKKRLCVSYAPLNERTITVVYPLPLVDDIIHDIAGCAYFDTMDLKSAYWQVSLRPQDYEKTTTGLWHA
ncbi:uncharacterized protein LOC121837496 [Ixodes scapularis]|uniref:uncharacterized protein LOC121837496 n=1 Tax=Ixodes scapularis TaxID=6945 RepID=UPI001C38F0BF|nr:uncharacterized protein LOC121837496 [Ixodes scapularis]